jgi:ketosteroid isomerase-like protein
VVEWSEVSVVDRRVAAAVAVMALIAGCGEKDSYGAAENALRSWLKAVHRGDASAACALMTPTYRRDLAAKAARSRHTSCEAGVTEMAEAAGRAALPRADFAMEVPVWDPSGEALVEVTHPTIHRVAKFWMQFEDGGWLVAGRA